MQETLFGPILGMGIVIVVSFALGSIPAVQRAIVRFSEWGITDDE